MEDRVQIWHNKRCSKSRNAFQWLADNNIDNECVHYMASLISKTELTSVLNKLNIQAFDLIRKKEKIFIKNWKGQQKTDAAWVEIMIENPQLIERPIVIKGDKAIIARPLELIEQLFK
jgi:arsenate reductase